MKKRLKSLLLLGILTTGTIHGLNCLAKYTAGLKNLLADNQGDYYNWKNGDIFYTVHGTGSPLLLIHDLNPASSGYEWHRLIKKLEKSHKVYTLDLLGCGRSHKPGLTYTSYLYVELIHDFISDIIKEKTSVLATGASASFTIMTSSLHKEDLDKLIIINPEALSETEKLPEDKSKFVKFLIELPVLGTFIYNIEMNEKNLTRLFKERYFSKPSLVSDRDTAAYFEAAHKGNCYGKYLLASMRGNYMNSNVKLALRKIDNLYFIGSRDRAHSVNIIDEYANYNTNIETAFVSGSKYLPQLEVPDKLLEILKLFL